MSGRSLSVASISARAALWCMSQPYRAVVWMRNAAYDRGWKKVERAPVPVISIGNLTAGGTGKTPTVAMLARRLRDQDIRVAILSRGYGAGLDGVNDEAKELEAKLPDVPHLQSPDRIASAKIACEELEMQVLILDDGFQHRKIHRDLDVVLLDAREPFGFEHLLPRGLLREPLRSLRRADIVVATRVDQVDAQRLAEIRTRVQRHNPKAAWIESTHRPSQLRNSESEVRDIEWIRDKKVVAISGIGNPESFVQTLRDSGANVLEHMTFPDHHLYTLTDVQTIEKTIREKHSDCEAIICTGKDLAKLNAPRIGRWPLWSLDIEITIVAGTDILDDFLKRIIEQIPQ